MLVCIMCVCGVCVCVSIEKRVPQLFMVKCDLKTTVCPSDRERLYDYDDDTTTSAAVTSSPMGGNETGGGDGDDEEEEMFSVIEPVHGMSTVKFIWYNIIFYVRV